MQNTATIPVGSNSIGELDANPGVDIGDADVTRIIPALVRYQSCQGSEQCLPILVVASRT